METAALSEEYLNKMRRLLGSSYEAYLATFDEPSHHGLRVNREKIAPEAFRAMAKAAWDTDFSAVPWCGNGFYYEEPLRPARHPWYYAGLYYLQEPSAMAPAALLPIEPGDRVLDLCAAPGGKSTELASRLGETGFLLSNDISNSRARALLKNLELFGSGSFCVSSEEPARLARQFAGFFDKILVDAPCSGEGMFRRDPDMVRAYAKRGPKDYLLLQREILTEAAKMLAPGGVLLYSTCTFDEEEDEGAIRYLLEQVPDLSLQEIPKEHGFEPGFGLPQCARLFPHRLRGEGHFVALLRREGDREKGVGSWIDPRGKDRGEKRVVNFLTGKTASSETVPFAAAEFLGQIGKKWDPGRFCQVKDQLYYLPEVLSGENRRLLTGIRWLRTGLYLGDLKRDRFEPSQALAMHLKAEEYPHCLSLSSSDPRVIRYLKGETLALSETERGQLSDSAASKANWILLCVDGFPLGWGRLQNGMLKNKYCPGWRWQ